MRTSKEGVYAAGDTAEAIDFFSGQYGLSGIIPSAVEQGKVAGANMAGEDIEYQGWVSMNVFNFFGNNVRSEYRCQNSEYQPESNMIDF